MYWSGFSDTGAARLHSPIPACVVTQLAVCIYMYRVSSRKKFVGGVEAVCRIILLGGKVHAEKFFGG